MQGQVSCDWKKVVVAIFYSCSLNSKCFFTFDRWPSLNKICWKPEQFQVVSLGVSVFIYGCIVK